MAQITRLDVRDATETPRHHKGPRTSVPFAGRIQRFLTSYAGQLTLALLLAVAARLWIMVSSHGMMDGDEAIMGLQAEQILHGARPIYFSGQAYMGSWDAYLLAPLIALFGPSAYVLHAVTLGESLLLVPLLGALATRLYGVRARLPAMLLAAIPPEYVSVGELRMLGGYVETLVLGTALLLLAVQVTARWREGRSTRPRWLLMGLLAGLGLWIDPLIVYYLLAGIIWLGPHAIGRARRGWAGSGWRWVRETALTAIGSVVALAFSAMPAIVYALQNSFENVIEAETGQPSSSLTSTQPGVAGLFPKPSGSLLHYIGNLLHKPVLMYLVQHDLPDVVGARFMWRTPAPLAFVIGVIVGGCVLAATVFVLVRVLAKGISSRRFAGLIAGIWSHWNDMLPFLLLAATFVFYWSSPRTAKVYEFTHPLQDPIGRYLLPMTTAFSLLLARAYVGLPALLTRIGWRRDGRGRGARWRLATALFALLLVAYAVPYVASDNVDAMQSPETGSMVFPAEDSGLLTYLDQHHITRIWANQWMCHLIMYLKDQQVLCGEYVDVVILDHELNRFPVAMTAVSAADRPSFVFDADPSSGEPAVLRGLDILGVRYTSAHFGSVWIVTPLSRTVMPLEIAPALVQDY